jgi:diguanylate cyclase (GGDEF)-like protein
VMEYGGHRLQVTISLGCASTPRQATSREQLIERADLALYASKHRGRNRATCYEEILSQPPETTEA